jgi:RimJ/RimL family protein N-acetyltransferase
MNSLNIPELTDGVIFLRPLRMEDAADHLAGEDEEMAKMGKRWTKHTSQCGRFHPKQLESWRSGGARRAFGVFDCATNRLIGFIEANLARLVGPDQVNVSYGIFPQWRRRGLALRAIDLMAQYLQSVTEASQMVLRIDLANTASLRMAEKAGFTFLGLFGEPEGRRARYAPEIQSPPKLQYD